MRRIPIKPKGLKKQAPPLFAALEDLDEFGHEVVRLSSANESDAGALESETGEGSSSQAGRINPKTRPTNKHKWRAPNVMADPFDDPLH